MRYDAQADCYICASGRKLPFRRECTQLGKQGRFQTMVYYRCESCANCPHREACCKAKDDKPKELRVSIDLLRISEQSRKNILTERGVRLRLNRSIQVEGAFGVLKSDRKFKRFLTRSRTNISTELYLLCLSYNLNKLWAKCNADRLQTHLFELTKE